MQGPQDSSYFCMQPIITCVGCMSVCGQLESSIDDSICSTMYCMLSVMHILRQSMQGNLKHTYTGHHFAIGHRIWHMQWLT